MKIRKDNERSMKAAQKLPYVSLADESRQLPHIENKNLYNIFEISKDMYTLYTKRNGFMTDEESRLKEA